MRVLLVANTLPPDDVSGVGEQVLQLAAGLVGQGHEVEILGRGPRGAPGRKLLFPLTVVGPFLRKLRHFRPHVIQVHESDGALVAWLAAVAQAQLEPRPLILSLLQVSYVEEMRAVRPLRYGDLVLGRPTLREWLFRVFKAPLQVGLGCLTASSSDLVLAPSRQTATEVERDYAVDSVEVVPNVTGGREVGSAVEAAVSEADFLLFVGRLRIRKGVEVLLHSLAGLDRESPEARLVIAGDGEHRRALEGEVRDLGLQHRVSFLGTCSAGRVRALMKEARALVVPSIYEGMPLVILEAMESALPIVASRVSGIPEVVNDGETGWLFEAEDVEELTAVLRQVCSEPDEARRRGQLGRQRLESGFRPAQAAEKWQQAVTTRWGLSVAAAIESERGRWPSAASSEEPRLTEARER